MATVGSVDFIFALTVASPDTELFALVFSLPAMAVSFTTFALVAIAALGVCIVFMISSMFYASESFRRLYCPKPGGIPSEPALRAMEGQPVTTAMLPKSTKSSGFRKNTYDALREK